MKRRLLKKGTAKWGRMSIPERAKMIKDDAKTQNWSEAESQWFAKSNAYKTQMVLRKK